MNQPRNSSDRLARHIMWGLVAGVALGLLGRLLLVWYPGWRGGVNWIATELLDPFGQIFLRLLFLVVVPLVFASIALGIVQLGRLDKLGPLAGRTFALFALNMAIGVALGLLMMNVLQPGERIDSGTRAQLLDEFRASARALEIATPQQTVSLRGFVEMFLPRNVLRAVVDFQILPLIAFALLVGAAGLSLRDQQRVRLLDALEIVTDLMTTIVHLALRLAPFAVAALLMSIVLKLGLQFLQALALFVAGVLAVMAVHLFGTMSLLLRLLSKRSPRLFFRAIRTIMVTAFSTSSSGATLPTSIQVSRESLGISASTAGFVLPLGATLNMSGSALYEGCVVLFVAQVYGMPMNLGTQLTLLVLAVLSAVAVAAIPGASLPLIVGLLVNFGLPPDGIALILGVDRVLDMARTVLNVTADVVTACIVDQRVNGGTGSAPDASPG